MARTPKNPETYINRNGLITRTVTTTTVKVEYVKLSEKQFADETLTIRKPGKTAIIEARHRFNDAHKNDNVQIINIEPFKSETVLVGMTEDEFIERGTILRPAVEVIKELENNENESE